MRRPRSRSSKRTIAAVGVIAGVSLPSAVVAHEQANAATAPLAPEPVVGVNELYTTSSTQMLAASVAGKKDGATVRASFVPLEAADVEYLPLLSEAKLTLFSDTSMSLTRISASTGVNPFNLRGPRAKAVQEASNAKYRCADEPTPERRARCNRERQSWQWAELRSTAIPAVTASFAVEFYPGGRVQDKDDPTTTAEAEAFGGYGQQLNLTFMPHERVHVDLWGSLRHARASGDPGTNMATYLGGGGTASWLLWSFFSWDTLARTPDYYREGFIPGLAVGGSLQGTHCDGGADCAKGRTALASATPFVDIRVKPALQVRMSFPINWYDAVGPGGTELAPVLTLAGLVSML